MAGEDFAAVMQDVVGVGLGNAAVIDDGGAGDVEGLDAAGVGFDFGQFVGVDDAQVGDAVVGAAPVDLLQAGEFGRVGGDDDLAALVVFDALFAAVLLESLDPFHAEDGLAGALLVVDAGVDDAAVVARLVEGEL